MWQAEATGKGAQTVYRDSAGRVVENAEELRKLKEAEAKAKKPEAEAPEWGGGLAQVLLRFVFLCDLLSENIYTKTGPTAQHR